MYTGTESTTYANVEEMKERKKAGCAIVEIIFKIWYAPFFLSLSSFSFSAVLVVLCVFRFVIMVIERVNSSYQASMYPTVLVEKVLIIRRIDGRY